MTTAEIKQIILEEIEAAMDDMANDQAKKDLIGPLATILSIPDATPNVKTTGQDDRIAQAMETGDEDELEDLAAGELDRAGLGEGRTSEIWKATPKFEQLIQYFSGKQGVEGLTQLMIRVSDNLFKTQNIGFKSRAKKYQSMYFVKGRSVKDGVKGTNDVERMRGFAELLLNPNGFTQKDIQNYVGLKNSAQANDFKMKLYRAKLINVVQEDDTEDVSESKKNLEFDFSQVNTPEKLPIDVEEQDLMDNIKKELKTSAEEYQNDDKKDTADKLKDAVSWVEKNGLKGKVTLEEVYNFLTEFHKQLPGDDKMFLHEPTILELIEDEFKPYVDTEEEYQKLVSSVKQYLLSKQPQAMSELEKYIKQVIKERKSLTQEAPDQHMFQSPETAKKLELLANTLASYPKLFKKSARMGGFNPNNHLPSIFQGLIATIGETLEEIKDLEGPGVMDYSNSPVPFDTIREGKNPLASRMKEIENQGRIAALETKLASISEFIEETQARLTRIDEDEEFNEMMDKTKVKEVRKQLKELEKAKLKLEKEMAKMEGKKAKKVVKDEPEAEEVVGEDFNEEFALSELTAFIQEGDQEAGERFTKEMEKINPSARKQFHAALAAMPADMDVEDIQAFMMGMREEKSYELNESVKRMQKLANLRG